MSDLISRPATLDALNAVCDRECEYSKAQRSVMCGACRLGSAVDAIENLPPAQIYTDEEIQKMQEIEQAQIQKAFALGREDALSEIIRCEDCKYYHPSYCKVWSRYGTVQTREAGYCYMAERREE